MRWATAKKRLRRLRRRWGLFGVIVWASGWFFWFLDQKGRWDTAKQMIATVRARLPDLWNEELWDGLVALVMDGRVMMVVGVGLVLWVLARPEDEQETKSVADETDDDFFEVQVYDGKSVTLSVKTGRPFVLGVRGRIISCSEDVNYSAPYEYKARPLGSGEALSHFQVASISDDVVAIHGEFNNMIDHWRIAFRPKFKCVVRFTFVAIEGHHAKPLDERTVTITATGSSHSHDSNRRLIAEITP